MRLVDVNELLNHAEDYWNPDLEDTTTIVLDEDIKGAVPITQKNFEPGMGLVDVDKLLQHCDEYWSNDLHDAVYGVPVATIKIFPRVTLDSVNSSTKITSTDMIKDLIKLDFGLTESESEEDDEEVEYTNQLLDRCEALLDAADYDWDYDGWGRIVMSKEAYENIVLQDAILSKEIIKSSREYSPEMYADIIKR